MKIRLLTVAILLLLATCFIYSQEMVYTIPEKELIPEGIAWNPYSGAFFLGSLNQGRILRIQPDGSYQDFIKPDRNDPFKIVGIKVDNERNLLWACVAQSFSEEDEKRGRDRYTGVHKYKLKNGELVDKYYVKIKNKNHLANDLVITALGQVYFTSYDGGMLYRINEEKGEVEDFLPLPDITSNGITISQDQRTLYIAGNEELYTVNLASKKLEQLKGPEGEILGHADGLYRYKNSLVAICHQTRNEKYSCGIRQYFLNNAGTEIIKCVDLARDHQDFVIPTTGALVGDQLVFIATSHLNNYKDSKIVDPANTKDVLIMSVILQ